MQRCPVCQHTIFGPLVGERQTNRSWPNEGLINYSGRVCFPASWRVQVGPNGRGRPQRISPAPIINFRSLSHFVIGQTTQQLYCGDLLHQPVLQAQSVVCGVSRAMKSVSVKRIERWVTPSQIARTSWSVVVCLVTLVRWVVA